MTEPCPKHFWNDPPSAPGCWVAYYSDRSAVAVFGSEIDALRHAVEHEMRVRFQPWGQVEFQ